MSTVLVLFLSIALRLADATAMQAVFDKAFCDESDRQAAMDAWMRGAP